MREQTWLASCNPNPATTFEAVVHMVQGGSGTGVHLGNGLVITCAHVVDAKDDGEDEANDRMPCRIGRRKVLMFPSGRVFISQCVSVVESLDGVMDVAALLLSVEIQIPAADTADR